MSETQPQPVISFRKPPVIERVVGGLCTPDANALASQMDRWTELVKERYPVVETVTNFEFNIAEKNGVPQLSSARPTIQIWHRHWRVNAKGEKMGCLQCRPDGFFVNIRRDSTGTHSFDELFREFQMWLPRWQETFSVAGFSGSRLLYVNELSEDVTPQFISSDRSLMIGKAIRVFANFVAPGPFGQLVLPYECRATIQLQEPPGATLTLHTKAAKQPEGKPPAVYVEIQVQGRAGEGILSLQKLLEQCTLYHTNLLSGFRSIFTDEALASFEPV